MESYKPPSKKNRAFVAERCFLQEPRPVAQTCHCGERSERNSLLALFCTKIDRRFSHHATLTSLIKQTLEYFDLPAKLEPHVMYRNQTVLQLIPWEMGKELAWDVTVVHVLAPSQPNQGFKFNSGTNATDAEARKIGAEARNYHELIGKGTSL